MAQPAYKAETDGPDPSGLDDFVAVTRAAGDRLRAQILRVLRADSFGVLELCHVFDMAQPALSHHLKVLHEAGLAAKHREGNSIFYRRAAHPNGALQTRLFEQLDEVPLVAELAGRLDEVYQRRQASSEAFFATHADALASQQTLISPSSAYADSIISAWRNTPMSRSRALEVGPGDGAVLQALCGDYGSVLGIDSSAAMLKAARQACSDLSNVRLQTREFGDLPTRSRFDLVVAAMVVHHMPSPARFFEHAQAMLAPGGMLVVAELVTHTQEWVRQACGDQWLGFEPEALTAWAQRAGLEPHAQEFLAQKNGFRIQTLSFKTPLDGE